MVNKLNKRQHNRFIKKLKDAVVEKDVENAYRMAIDTAFGDEYTRVESPYQCDGFFNGNLFLKLLLETKYKADFLDKKIVCNTLAQALAYIKKFKDDGQELPNVVLVGDENECFLVSGSPLYKYLKDNYDWEIAPSDFSKGNPGLVVKMIKDKDINPYVFNINDSGFNFNDVCNAIDELAINGETTKIQINEQNIRNIYESYLRNFFNNKNDYSTNLLVSVFVRMILGDDDCFINPNNPNELLVLNNNNTTDRIRINGSAFYCFFARFSKDYSPAEKDKINEIADRLLEDTNRRRQGSFWTPTIWANRAEAIIENYLGQNWKQEYYTWDACCGSCNLTRDIRFPQGHLFCSTLFQEELNLASGYNHEAIKFQYDFLNDDVSMSPLLGAKRNKLPNELYEVLIQDKPIIFYMNPPYGTANNAGAKGTDKAKIADTNMLTYMRKKDYGKSMQQLFSHFFARILKLKEDFTLSNVAIAFFCKPIFFSGIDYAKFRKIFFNEFDFLGGNLFCASDFADVSSNWGITFSVFKSRKNRKNNIQNLWKLDIENWDGNEITINGSHNFFAFPDNEGCHKWIREPVKNLCREERNYPYLSSALRVSKSTKKPSGTLLKNSLGYLVNVSNNVYNSSNDVFFLSSAAYKGHGISVNTENFDRIIANFSARKLVIPTWINDKDNFHIPNIEHPEYQQWLNDCYIWFIFNNANYAASARNFEYMDKQFIIRNNMFWLSPELVKNKANEVNNDVLYNDAKLGRERYILGLISKIVLSPLAQDVLDLGSQILFETLQYRKDIAYLNPEMHLNTWDAGWYQIKFLLKQISDNKIKELKTEFDNKYKELTEKLRPGIYQFGFLEE